MTTTTTLSMGGTSNAVFTLDEFGTVLVSANKATGTIAFKSAAENLRSSFSAALQSKVYGPFGVPTTVTIAVTGGSIDYTPTYPTGARLVINDDGSYSAAGASVSLGGGSASYQSSRLSSFMAKAATNNGRKRASPLLDSLATASFGAWGLTKLISAYAGNCMRVVRASDSVTLDVPFGADGIVDTAILAAFQGASTLAVSILYDQKSTNNLTQTTAINRPILDLTFSNNGIPVMICASDAQFQGFTIPAGVSITSKANASVWTVCAPRSNRTNNNAWDIGATPGTFSLEISPISAALGVQPRADGTLLNFNAQINIPQARVSVNGLNSAAGGLDFYVNDQKYSRAAITSGAVAGGNVPGTATPAYMDLCAFIVFNSAVTAADAQLLQFGLPQVYGASAPTLLANVVLQGDSITASGVSGVTTNYKRLLDSLLPPQIALYSYGKGGQTMFDMVSDAPFYIDPLFRSGMTNICVMLGGVNDYFVNGTTGAQLLTILNGWIASRKAIGYKIIVATLFQRNIGTGTDTVASAAERVVFNAGVRALLTAKTIDAIADFDLDPGLVPISTTDFPDNLHPVLSGYRKATAILVNAISSVLPTLAP